MELLSAYLSGRTWHNMIQPMAWVWGRTTYFSKPWQTGGVFKTDIPSQFHLLPTVVQKFHLKNKTLFSGLSNIYTIMQHKTIHKTIIVKATYKNINLLFWPTDTVIAHHIFQLLLYTVCVYIYILYIFVHFVHTAFQAEVVQ